ncbi:YfhE-like protein [Cytobacillus oceanisediminis]|jgi:hypothetical protein|uniref:YfhE-like protein n=1 Tax=Cytobacillus oceanisediminis TaxID=665099 RepID=A0A2V2ZQT0_9BACI|nr:YfhE family protein [Cytobacillus oceanisediminis]PWW20500.1 YfhE-like protein [Cytobacillus oceanisediminis]
MKDKNVPYKGFNTEQSNGLSETQEVNYSSEFKEAYKAEHKQDSKESDDKNDK